MRRVLLVGALILLWCAPAQAATVARSGEFTLHAREDDGQLCITLRRERRYQGQECGPIPRSPHRALQITPDIGFDNYASAVPGSVHTAELESRNGQRTRHPTFAARGFSSRFVLLPAPPSAVFVRFYGADGALLGIDPGPAGYIDIFANETSVFGTHEAGVEAHTEAWLEPTPEQPDRLRTLACVDVVNSGGGTGVCDRDSDNQLVVMGSCDGPDLVGGVVAAGVVTVRLTLTSGETHIVPTRALPDAFGGRRAVGAPVPRGQGVREAVAFDALGQQVAGAAVGAPPGGQPCAGEDRGDDRWNGPLLPIAPPPGAVAVGAAGPDALLVADQGERLCVGLVEVTADLCAPPPVDSDQPRLIRRGTSVAGALGRDAAQVTLRLDRGRAITVRTTDGAAYTGRWAGDVRFFAAKLPAGRTVTGALVRDAAGAIVGTGGRDIDRPPVRQRVLIQRGGLGLHVVAGAGDQQCISAFASDLPRAAIYCTDLDPGTQIDGPSRPYAGTVSVACAPRRAIAYGRFPDRLPAPRVLLEGGRTIRSRTISLRGDDAWVAFLPNATVRGLRAGEHRVRLRLPPASRHCGYSASRSF
jgi:hypothetical protein